MKHVPQIKRAVFGALFAIALLLMPCLIQAQTVKLVAQPLRVTVPVNQAVSNNITCVATVSGTLNTTPIHLSLDPALPLGASYLLSTNDFTNTCTVTISIYTTNVAQGVYALALDASGGAVRTLPLTLQVAHMWSASDATNGISTNWESTGNWANGQVSSATSDVVFNDAGGLASGVTTTNVAVDVDTEIASLRFSELASATRRFNVSINPGVKFKVTGTNGFWLLTDRSDLAGAPFNVFFSGADGLFIVTNPAASIEAFAAPNSANLFDLSSLGTWLVDVSQFGISDYQNYPGYTNLLNNSYASTATLRQMEAQLRFARTNYITVRYPADTNNWMDTAFRSYALVYGRNDSSGNGTRGNLYFGISNVFNLDSAVFFGAGTVGEQAANNMFNPAFIASNCVAIFRNTNGGRMSMFAIGDGAGNTSSGSGTKGQLNFTGGRADILTDRLYLARERTNSSGANVQGLLTLSAGVVDANTVIAGYQGQNTNLVVWTGAANCQGTLTINTSAVLRVNNTLILGYTTWPTPGTPASIETGFGQVNANGGGTVMANTITVGGDSKISINNNISITAGSSLVISNTLADPIKPLNSLTISGGSTLTLHVDGTRTNSYVYVSTLNAPAAQGNMIQISTVKNLTALQVPLITFNGGLSTVGFAGVTLPAGLHGSLIGNGANELDLLITPSTNNLIWRGYSSANWNLADTNWLDVATGLHTNFQTGDSVTFDDAAGVPTTINISDPIVVPTQITMTNTANLYTFNGSGSIQGGATLTKTGSNALEIDGATTVTIVLNQGSLVGNNSGQVGAVSIAAGATMDFAGKILNGTTCSGTATFEPTATMAGALSIQTGGIVTNFGTINSSFSVGNNGVLVNGLNGNFTTFGSSTVGGTNAFLLNRGFLGPTLTQCGVNLTINNGSTFEDTGEGWVTMTGTLTIAPGATFIPGGDGIGTTYIFRGTGSGFTARVLLSQGSTNIFKVNNDNSTYTQLQSGNQDFGASASTRTFNGATIKIVNVGSSGYTPGQSFMFFAESDNGGTIVPTGTATNTWPVIDPTAPAPSQGWDISTVTVSGVIRVVAIATNSPTLGFAPQVTSTDGTNRVILTTLSWPSDHTGWTLQQLQPPLTIGVLATNWQDIFGSYWTNSVVTTNTVTTNGSATFYRLKYP